MSTTIRTERLELRLLAGGDAADVFAYARDPEVAKNTSWVAHRSIGDAEAYVAFVVGAHSEEDDTLRHVWAIRRIGDDTVIGTIDLHRDTATRAGMDFALARPHWNQGIMTEAGRAVLEWGFRRLPDLEEVHSGGLTRNVGTRRVLEKLGFELSGRRLAELRKFPEPIEVSHFVLRREAFAPR